MSSPHFPGGRQPELRRAAPASATVPLRGRLARLPRRAFVQLQPAETVPPMLSGGEYRVRFWRALAAFWVWLRIGLVYLLARRGDPQRSAARFQRAFERAGGYFNKIGQLLAMRIDLLPWEHCIALARLVDQLPPFPLEQAIARVEAACDAALPQVFAQFDPQPIVSSSLACTYQARLLNGRMVAVKVQRPGSGEAFFSILKALDWLLEIFEFLSLLRPGFTQSVRLELREALMDELNFALEARHQALFRKEARKSEKKFFTAPRVYARLSSEHVIVQEFTAGMWLWEVLAAVEQHDPQALQRMRELNIQPRRVARRLMWVNAWGLDEYLLFRAELRPDNVIVQANSRLCFLDFSSVGVMGRERREAVQHIMANAARRDPLEMARESLVLLEPLPPLDVLAFTHDLESAYWQYLYGLESRQVAWWERTSIRLWLGFVQTARAHQVTLSIQVLRLIRSCLQHDLLAARLSPGLDHERQYRRFGRYRARQARQRLVQQAAAQFDHGLQDRFFLEVEGLAHTGERLFRQLQRSLAAPVMKFNAVLDKPVYVLTIVLRWLGQLLLVSTLGLGIGWLIVRFQTGLAPGLPVLLPALLAHPLYWLAALFVTATNLRMVLFRLGDKDV